MLLRWLACNVYMSRLPCRANCRTISTFLGESGRVYSQCELLLRHPTDRMYSVYKAESRTESFVFKSLYRQLYDLNLRHAAEAPQLHIDRNDDDNILVYPYFRDTLLCLIENHPELPLSARKEILRYVGEAIQKLRANDWIHIGKSSASQQFSFEESEIDSSLLTNIKPDKILVDWIADSDEHITVTNVALGDFDIAFESECGQPRDTPYPIGNVMWRSLEGQTGSGVTKASDMFSFGLVCIYVLGGVSLLILDDYQEVAKLGVLPGQEILTRHLSYFLPICAGLLKHVSNEDWRHSLASVGSI